MIYSKIYKSVKEINDDPKQGWKIISIETIGFEYKIWYTL